MESGKTTHEPSRLPAQLGGDELPKKTSTQRVQAYRERQKNTGATQLGMVLTPATKAAIEILMAHHNAKSTKTAIEKSVIAQAQTLCGDGADLKRLHYMGKISDKSFGAWQKFLSQQSPNL